MATIYTKKRRYSVYSDKIESNKQINNVRFSNLFNCVKSVDQITRVVFYDGVKQIGSFVFKDCKKLKSVILPMSLNVICESAFENCNLFRVNFPKNVNTVEKFAFKNCPRLREVVIQNNDINIDEKAFVDCDVEIIFLGDRTFYKNNYKYLDFDKLDDDTKRILENIFEPKAN